MLFNSYDYLLWFLPATLLVFFALGARPRLAQASLTVASLVFYGWWDLRYLPLILGSVVVNFAIARALQRRPSRPLLAAGIALNLGLLGVFKYADFFLANVARLTGGRAAAPPSRASARHQLLHVHADRVSGRCPSAPGAGARIRELRALRHVLSSSARRADPAPQRDDAAVRGTLEQAAAGGEPRLRPVPARDRTREEGADRGHVRADRRCGIRRPRNAVRGGRMDRGARLHDADLFRFLRLHRHGAGRRAHVQHPDADQFRLAVPLDRHPRVLASLAHHAVAFPA